MQGRGLHLFRLTTGDHHGWSDHALVADDFSSNERARLLPSATSRLMVPTAALKDRRSLLATKPQVQPLTQNFHTSLSKANAQRVGGSNRHPVHRHKFFIMLNSSMMRCRILLYKLHRQRRSRCVTRRCATLLVLQHSALLTLVPCSLKKRRVKLNKHAPEESTSLLNVVSHPYPVAWSHPESPCGAQVGEHPARQVKRIVHPFRCCPRYFAVTQGMSKPSARLYRHGTTRACRPVSAPPSASPDIFDIVAAVVLRACIRDSLKAIFDIRCRAITLHADDSSHRTNTTNSCFGTRSCSSTV